MNTRSSISLLAKVSDNVNLLGFNCTDQNGDLLNVGLQKTPGKRKRSMNSYNTFPFGVNECTCVAYDHVGLTASCNFRINITITLFIVNL